MTHDHSCASLFTGLRLDAVLYPNLGHSPSLSSIFFLYSLGTRTEFIETGLEDYQLYLKISSYNTYFVLKHCLSYFLSLFLFLWLSLFPPLWPSGQRTLIDFFNGSISPFVIKSLWSFAAYSHPHCLIISNISSMQGQ